MKYTLHIQLLWTKKFHRHEQRRLKPAPTRLVKITALHFNIIIPSRYFLPCGFTTTICINVKHKMCQKQIICSLTWRIQGDRFGGYAPIQHLDHQHSLFPGSWQWLHPQTWGMSAERLSRQQPSGLPVDMGA